MSSCTFDFRDFLWRPAANAQLRQLGIEAEVVLRTSPVFDGRLDQVESIRFELPAMAEDRVRLGEILQYYVACYRETPVSMGELPRLSRGEQTVTWAGNNWQQLLAS